MSDDADAMGIDFYRHPARKFFAFFLASMVVLLYVLFLIFLAFDSLDCGFRCVLGVAISPIVLAFSGRQVVIAAKKIANEWPFLSVSAKGIRIERGIIVPWLEIKAIELGKIPENKIWRGVALKINFEDKEAFLLKKTHQVKLVDKIIMNLLGDKNRKLLFLPSGIVSLRDMKMTMKELGGIIEEIGQKSDWRGPVDIRNSST